MQLKIESMRATEEGTQICGLMRMPICRNVPPLRNLESDTALRREERLHEWSEEARELNKKYAKELCAYRRVHLGLVTLKQEDMEE